MYVYLCMYERMSPRMDMGGLLKYIHCVYAYGYAYYLVFYAKILFFKIIKNTKDLQGSDCQAHGFPADTMGKTIYE